MSAPNAKPAPRGGLTWEREKVVVVVAAAPVAVLDIFLGILFPHLPLSAPFGGAILAQVLLGIPFRRLLRPVERPRLLRFVAATVLTASATMVGAALAIHAMGWSAHSLPAILAGFGGTMFALYHIHKWLFRIMVERLNGTVEEEKATH